jgi:hypothetical protein
MQLLLLVLPLSTSSLQLQVYNNTAMAEPPCEVSVLDTLELALPGAHPLSLEVTGTLNIPAANASLTWAWACNFENIEFAFVTVDGHNICPSSDSTPGAYNNSARGIVDNQRFRLLSKKTQLVITMRLYHLSPTSGDVKATVRLCAAGLPCGALPAAWLSPELPDAEVQRRRLQKSMTRGWGSWLHRSILSIVLLPDAAVLTIAICRISTGGPRGAPWSPIHSAKTWPARQGIKRAREKNALMRLSYIFRDRQVY